jgi:hypothetical protein
LLKSVVCAAIALKLAKATVTQGSQTADEQDREGMEKAPGHPVNRGGTGQLFRS